MTTIYDQFDKAFASTTAAVVLDKDGNHVARIVIKHGAAVTAYVHWLGTEMVRGQARGGGYDRASAAVASAATKPMRAMPEGSAAAFWIALSDDTGLRWERRLEDAGFRVLFAIA